MFATSVVTAIHNTHLKNIKLIKNKRHQEFITNVVVQFYPWFNISFLLFLGMVMYDNEFQTKKIKIEPRIKLNHNTNIIEQLNDENQFF